MVFRDRRCGRLVGLVLGNIRLCVVVFAASSPAAGAGANIGISAVAAPAAGVTHIRAGRDRPASPAVLTIVAGAAMIVQGIV